MTSSPSKRLCNNCSMESNGTAKRQKSSSNSDKDQPLKSISSNTTFFRLLCHASKIGSITREEEEDGVFLSQVFRETGMEVRVEDPIRDCEERVIVIKGSGKAAEVDADRKEDDGTSDDGNVGEQKLADVPDSRPGLDVSSRVQKALFLVVERTAELKGGTEAAAMGKEKQFQCVVRLVVLTSQVCYVLGKGGSVIQRMSRGSGAQIRILPKEKLPSCVSASDEIVQIAGDADAVRKAIHSISEQLLGNPPFGFEFPPASSSSHSSSNLARVSDDPPREKPTFRLLCPDERVGWIIGKGGSIIKTLKHDTGCDITIPDGRIGSHDRVIHVSGPAHPADRISPVQDAVLRVQARISGRAASDTKGVNAPARLIVSSNQVGFLLGQGSSNMSELKRLSGAEIQIGADKIHKDALEGDEIVQIGGDHGAIQEALLLVSARLLHHFFLGTFPWGPRTVSPRNGNGMGFSSSPLLEFDHSRGPPYRDGLFPRDHLGPEIPPDVYERKSRFPQGSSEGDGPILTSVVDEVVVPSSLVPVIHGEDGACLKQVREFSDAKIVVRDTEAGAAETVIVIYGTPEQRHAAQSLIQAFVLSEIEVFLKME